MAGGIGTGTRLVLAGAAVALLLLLSVWFARRPREPDMVAVLHANNRGIGLMEQFRYAEAEAAFREVIRQAPEWLPGHINHGIALLNQAKPEALEQAVRTFKAVLAKDRDSWHAHYCLGIILQYQGADLNEAARHFQMVNSHDPADAHTWYFLGRVRLDQERSAEAQSCFEKALRCDPYLVGAMNNLQLLLRRAGQDEQADVWLARFQKLKAADWYTAADVKYGEMGRYADAIGRQLTPTNGSGPLPLFQRDQKARWELSAQGRWTAVKDMGKDLEAGLVKLVRARFGGTMVVFDYDRDGRPDLLLLQAVAAKGRLHDVLFRNEGAAAFRDVTEAAGLNTVAHSLGCSVADFDNDGFPDLLLTTAAGPRLLRNRGAAKGEQGFEDITKDAGLAEVPGVCLAAAFADVDQDGDLDLILAQFAPSVAVAVDILRGSAARAVPGGPLLLLNVGVAPAVKDGVVAPLEPRFRLTHGVLPETELSASNVLVADLDSDRDVDLLVLGDGQTPLPILNDRLLQFRRSALPQPPAHTARWNGGLALDADQDEKSDLLLLQTRDNPLFLMQGRLLDVSSFSSGSTDAPPLVQAQAVDIDLDGWTDIVGLTEARRPLLLHNDSKRLVRVNEALGADADWPKDPVALAVLDADGDHRPDFVVWSESEGLRLYRNQGNGNHGLPVELSGLHDKGAGVRTNADAVGAWVRGQVPSTRPGLEIGTLQAGLGQSRVPWLLGLGRYDHVDVLSVRWPDGTWQAELNLPAGQRALVRQTNRKPVSCPILFAWDGRRYTFVADFLGAGAVGECLPDGNHRQPRPEESVSIEPEQLVVREGRYLFKIAEPMDEVTYLDRLQLLVIDHPQELRVFPDERFTADPRGPSQDLLAFESRRAVYPRSVRDHRGRNLTATLRQRDRVMADGFATRAWLGYAEEHAIELDFGDQLAQLTPQDRVVLFLAGWTDYPFPDSIWAATQADVALQPPLLERQARDGSWQVIRAELGFPAGTPRMMTADVTGAVGGKDCRLRIRTNMQVYWDQAFIAPISERMPQAAEQGDRLRVQRLPVLDASLSVRGCMQEISPDGRAPTIFDYDRLDPVPVTRLRGALTRLGDVTELLHERDDRFVTFGPGDELSVAFAAERLPPLPAGWSRSYVLRTWGYCKDASPFTATGGTIEPLPFAAMSRFPYAAPEHYPQTPLHEKYLREYQTRQGGRR